MRRVIPFILAGLLFTATAPLLKAQMQVERLSRGAVAVRNGQGYYLSWRLLAHEQYNTGFNIYRGNTRLNGEPVTGATCYYDSVAPVNSLYYVRAVTDGVERQERRQARIINLMEGSNAGYFDILLDRPANGIFGGAYAPGDASAGDLNGDGEYEIVLKWDPDNAKDNAHSGTTDNVYLDACTLDGDRLWRIDLGPNIRAGAHYTQFLVYDFDGNGRAEIMVKTAPGTKDGTGKYLSKGPAASANHAEVYRNAGGYILSGPEYISVFDGTTGSELATENYWPPRGSVSSWGDNYGNRVDRFNAAVAYVDGERPSGVFQRGYYTRMTFAAWDWRNGELTRKWTFDSNTAGNGAYYGQGNHSLCVIDANGDSRQDLVTGSSVISGDGTGMHTSGMGHGDATHVTFMRKNDPRPMIFMPHESGGHGVSLRYADNGEMLFKHRNSGDTGRGCAGELDPSTPGFHFWASGGLGLYDISGTRVGNVPNSINFVVWWDGNLSRELMNGNTIDRWKIGINNAERLLTGNGAGSINGTKSTPVLQADLFGDWREEVILRRNDNKALRVYTTVIPTNHKLYTFMQDPVYRVAVSWQNSSYNQPPHPGFYVASDMDFPPPAPQGVPVAGFNRGSGEIIKDLMVYDDLNAIRWQVTDNLNASESVYGDKAYFPSLMPGYLEGSEWIRTSAMSAGFESSDGLARFTVLREAKICVIHPATEENRPAWLSAFSLKPEKVVLSVTGQAPAEMSIFEKEVSGGDTILLGTIAAGQPMYFVTAQKTDSTTHIPVTASNSGLDLKVCPNPCDGICRIDVFYENEDFLSVGVFDLNGRLIQSLLHERSRAGYHSLLFDGTHLPAGIYIVCLQNNKQMIRRKIILSK
ncbi:MAG TPA: T9SS type A sorting domain-containing protein [Prolixibacteraceae bacterium]|nr:T9SS type A sorting domain-containing protein [Bacteroidales bacterium]HNZ70185.1 T9SS type A sorting domain-containing protein [Prolixibacteraceae bacterium]HOC86975.1 T9SS type A sorting domain-containing protein [Prolixibacteraceae bacterium]HOG95609.1 T9SS type A sorting domain-containing protein [Prolixibacteraceae bacterium]HOY92254.1 T9SS type A sorting domain-containing protein [Prolixibacteraceae bacterium]